ncbi:MAG: hypothetical protein V2A58_11295 [Planctomycetota bacterium]
MSRETYSDGRWMPQDGDTVYQATGGMFGTGACWYGVVKRNRDGKLRVHLTESVSTLGGQCAAGRRQTYNATDGRWTVKGDPEIERRKVQAEQERLEREAKARQWTEERKAKEAENIRTHGRIEPGSLKLGDRLCCVHTGARGTVAEIDERGEAYLRWDGDAVDQGPGFVGSLDSWYRVSD